MTTSWSLTHVVRTDLLPPPHAQVFFMMTVMTTIGYGAHNKNALATLATPSLMLPPRLPPRHLLSPRMRCRCPARRRHPRLRLSRLMPASRCICTYAHTHM